jgi:hypothetical protein
MRFGVEVGSRSILGLNFRMNELTAAVVLPSSIRSTGSYLPLGIRGKSLRILLREPKDFISGSLMILKVIARPCAV